MKQKKAIQNENISSSFNLLDSKRQNQLKAPLNLPFKPNQPQESVSNKENDLDISFKQRRRQLLQLAPNTAMAAAAPLIGAQQR